ncbi:MAG: hypothetical protein ACO3JL_19465, partial [Myxococcota bacterium]
RQAFVIRKILCHFGLPDPPPEVPRSRAPPDLDFALTTEGRRRRRRKDAKAPLHPWALSAVGSRR